MKKSAGIFRNRLTAIVSAVMILTSCFASFCFAADSEITIYDCLTDPNSALLVSGYNGTSSSVIIGLSMVKKSDGTVIMGDQITAAKDSRFYFTGIDLTPGKYPSGLCEIRISDGASFNVTREIYIAGKAEAVTVLKELYADPDSTVAVLNKKNDSGILYGDIIGTDTAGINALQNTNALTQAIKENKEKYKLSDAPTDSEFTSALSAVKSILKDQTAIQSYNEKTSSDEISAWFTKYSTSGYTTADYDSRYDFSGYADAPDSERKDLYLALKVRNDMKTADASDSGNRLYAYYEKLKAAGSVSGDTSDKCLAEIRQRVIDNTILTMVYKMATSYSRNFIVNNRTLVPFATTYYNKLSSVALKNKAIENALGKDYSSIAALDEAIEKSCQQVYDDSRSDTGGGGGGGSGSGSGGGGNSSSGGSSGPMFPQTTAAPKNSVNSASSEQFNDINDLPWAEESINKLCEMGALKGFGDGTFRPNDNITRAEFVKLVIAAFAFGTDAAECSYGDVNADDWYYPYIASATQLGIVSGNGDGTFTPQKLITREEISVILTRAAQKSGRGLTGSTVSFSDNDDISDYARESVSLLYGSGIIGGMGDGTFSPKSSGTRAQAAKMIYYTLKIA